MSKKIVWIIAGVLLFLFLAWGGATYYANQKVAAFITKANEGDNQLNVNDWQLSIGFLTVGLNADDVSFKQRVASQEISGTLANLKMKGFSIRSLLFAQQSRIQTLELNGPQLTFHPLLGDTIQPDTSSTPSERSLPLIADFRITDGQLRYQATADTNKVLKVFGLQLEREKFSLNTLKNGWQNASFSLDSIHYPKDNNTATWRIDQLRYQPNDSLLRVAKIELAPHELATPFLRRQQHDEDWLAISFDTVQLYPFQPDSLLCDQASLALKTLSIRSLSIANYVDPDLPDAPRKPAKLMPVESFRRLPFELDIQDVNIEQAQIIYAMHRRDKAPAELAFTNGQIKMRNLCTPSCPDSLYLDLNFTFDRATSLEAHFAMDQLGSGRNFRLWGQLGDYEMVKINPLMITAANAYIEEGQMHSLSYEASVQEEVSTGQMLFRYQDLKVDLQNSWFKNLVKGIILKDSNPDQGGTLRYGQIYHEHPSTKSFFNLYWKSILSGLKSTVMADTFNKERLKSVAVDK